MLYLIIVIYSELLRILRNSNKFVQEEIDPGDFVNTRLQKGSLTLYLMTFHLTRRPRSLFNSKILCKL